jgi:hypothetical protein
LQQAARVQRFLTEMFVTTRGVWLLAARRCAKAPHFPLSFMSGNARADTLLYGHASRAGCGSQHPAINPQPAAMASKAKPVATGTVSRSVAAAPSGSSKRSGSGLNLDLSDPWVAGGVAVAAAALVAGAVYLFTRPKSTTQVSTNVADPCSDVRYAVSGCAAAAACTHEPVRRCDAKN